MRNAQMRPHVPFTTSPVFNMFGLAHFSSLSSDAPILLDRMVSSDIDDAESQSCILARVAGEVAILGRMRSLPSQAPLAPTL